jgi:hypothetical protein
MWPKSGSRISLPFALGEKVAPQGFEGTPIFDGLCAG